MAHTSCFKNHDMWNGDGKPEVWAFRVDFFKDYMLKHPGFVLGDIFGEQIYDCVEDFPDEYLDCWYCDKCGCLAVFYSHYRIDYEPIEDYKLWFIDYEELYDYKDYIACRNQEFETFQYFYEGKNPLYAIEKFPFILRYKVSHDNEYIYGYNENKQIVIGFKKVRFIDFSSS